MYQILVVVLKHTVNIFYIIHYPDLNLILANESPDFNLETYEIAKLSIQ